MLVIADHSEGRVPLMDVDKRYRPCMLVMADHAEGRVPLMDVLERDRYHMLVIAVHAGGKVPFKFPLLVKSNVRRLILILGVSISVGRTSADSPKSLITSSTTASGPSQLGVSHFTPGHVQGSDGPHQAFGSFHWGPPSKFFRAHSSVRMAGLRSVMLGGPPRWSDTETAPENPLMRPLSSLLNFKSSTS